MAFIATVLNFQSTHTRNDDSWDLLEAARLHYERRLACVVACFTVGVIAAASIVFIIVL